MCKIYIDPVATEFYISISFSEKEYHTGPKIPNSLFSGQASMLFSKSSDIVGFLGSFWVLMINKISISLIISIRQ